MLSPRLDGSKEPYKYRGLRFAVSGSRLADCEYRLSLPTTHRKPKTANRTPNTDNLFKCGVGQTQAAITPLGELKMCLMIDYPKYKILDTEDREENRLSVIDRPPPTANRPPNLKDAWEKLKELVRNIKPDENYQCDRCELEPYCKWCPAKGWLYNKTFTSCEPESRRWAEIRKQEIAVFG
jgi:radical SAM protein with 4Fe4S-binding SPASM domain